MRPWRSRRAGQGAHGTERNARPRRRAAAVVAAVGLTLGPALTGCAESRPATRPPDDVPTRWLPADRANTAADAGPCAAVERPPLQAGGHLLPGATPPVPYSSRPPTSGWHTSARVPTGMHDEPLSEPQQVTVLEDGGIVVTYGELALEEAEALETFVVAHQERVAATPDAQLHRGHVVLSAWGVLRRCERFDAAAAAAFVAEFAGHGPPH